MWFVTKCKFLSLITLGFFVFIVAVIVLLLRQLPSHEREPIKSYDVWTKEADQEVVEAAEVGFPRFLEAITDTLLTSYNFNSREEIQQASLGEPFQVHTILPERIIDYKGGTPILKIVSPTSLWLFPVMSNHQIRALLTVDLINDTWQATAIGSSGLAAQLSSALRRWPSSDNYDYIIVRVFQATSDFLILSHYEEIKILPLTSAIVSLGLTRDGFVAPDEIMSKLKRSVDENLKLYK